GAAGACSESEPEKPQPIQQNDPDAACTSDECGPQPDLADASCPDGGFALTSHCDRDPLGTCRWQVVECSALKRCGGRYGAACGAAEYCKLQDGACHLFAPTGGCEAKPQSCA